MSYVRIEYFDENLRFPKPLSLLHLFSLLKTWIEERIKKPKPSNQWMKSQTEFRTEYVILMLKLINRITDPNKNYDEEWGTN